MLYFAPVTSYAKSQEDLILLRDKKDNKILGSIRFNYMIPVPKQCLHKLEIKSLPTEKSRVHTSKELSFCRRKRDNIYKTALKTYKRVTEKKMKNLLQIVVILIYLNRHIKNIAIIKSIHKHKSFTNNK